MSRIQNNLDIHNKQETQQMQEHPTKSKRFVQWVKDHKGVLVMTGIGIAAVVASVIRLSDGSSDDDTSVSDDGRMAKDVYPNSFFKRSSVEELREERERVRLDYCNPDLDLDYRAGLYYTLNRFDEAIYNKQWAGIEPGYPVHSEHGLYLPSDD